MQSKFLPLDGEGGRRSLPDEVTKAEGFCFTNTPHPMATPSALPAVGEGNDGSIYRGDRVAIGNIV